jgi:iron complex transport system ATP-binding protein
MDEEDKHMGLSLLRNNMNIEIESLSSGYPGKPVLEEVTIQFPEQGFCALLGPNGTGKSTLLKTMVGFLPITCGNIMYNGIRLHDWHRLELAKKLAMIPQELEFQFDYQVRELVLMGRFPYLTMWQNYTQQDEDITDTMMDTLHLSPLAHKFYLELSGGEKQRVLIARALVQYTDVILLDESLSQLDINYQVETMNLLREIATAQQKLVILVSHNINLAANYCDMLYLMKAGKLIEHGTAEQVIRPELLQQLFGITLDISANTNTGRPNFQYPGPGRN